MKKEKTYFSFSGLFKLKRDMFAVLSFLGWSECQCLVHDALAHSINHIHSFECLGSGSHTSLSVWVELRIAIHFHTVAAMRRWFPVLVCSLGVYAVPVI